MQLPVFAVYLFLAVYNAGNMLTLQIQHYGIYYFVNKEGFKEYMAANNRSALIPSIIPAMLLLLINLLLLFYRPAFMPFSIAAFSLVLNIIAFISTFTWQRSIQAQMAISGFDEKKIRLLCSTNWIRTIVFFVQAIVAVTIIIRAI
jgi:hypothetical protein